MEPISNHGAHYGGVVMANTWTSSDPQWKTLTDSQKAAAMALMEAGLSKPNDAINAASAMVNRSSRTGEPLGQHVSRSIYQPTIEQTQHDRLGKILSSPQFVQMTDWVERRQRGEVPDPVSGSTHFLAKPSVMLALEEKEPSKYKNWGPRGANWTGYNQETGRYSNQVFEDSSHAFLIPEEMGGAKTSEKPQGKTAMDGVSFISDLGKNWGANNNGGLMGRIGAATQGGGFDTQKFMSSGNPNGLLSRIGAATQGGGFDIGKLFSGGNTQGQGQGQGQGQPDASASLTAAAMQAAAAPSRPATFSMAPQQQPIDMSGLRQMLANRPLFGRMY